MRKTPGPPKNAWNIWFGSTSAVGIRSLIKNYDEMIVYKCVTGTIAVVKIFKVRTIVVPRFLLGI